MSYAGRRTNRVIPISHPFCPGLPWISRSTHADHLRVEAERLGGAWMRLWERLYSNQSRQQQLAEAGLVDWDRGDACTEVNERIVTHLGDGTVDISADLTSPFYGTEIKRIPVPARWLRDTPAGAEVVSKGNTVLIGNERLLYDETGLSRCR